MEPTTVPRLAWPPAARTAAAVIATAALVLLGAACSGSPSSTGSGDSPNAAGSASSGSLNSQLVAFSRCMRSHGVPNFPDPPAAASNEKFLTAQQLGVSSSRYQGAEDACQHLLPAGIDDVFPPAEVPVLLSGMREFSQCMRSHGVPDYPGPDSSGQLPKIGSGQQVGVSDSRLTAAQGACQALWPYQAPTQAQLRQQLTGDLKFAQCMRSHGLPDFPDPTTVDGQPEFVISISRDGFDPHSPQVLAKVRVCERVLPPGVPRPSATVAP